MRLHRRLLLAALLAAPLAGPAPAAETVAARTLVAEPPYLTASRLDLTLLLPPPPPPGSAEQARDLAAAIAMQEHASAARIAQAVADANQSVFDMFGRTLGPRFAPAALPAIGALFARLGATEDAVVDPVKAVFARRRPYLADPRVRPLVRASADGSYPSGHATRVTLAAIVLGAMLPGQRASLWARADDYARSRIIGGMHYPLDVEAGRRAGTAIAALLFADPAFRDDFAAARAELRQVLGQSPASEP